MHTDTSRVNKRRSKCKIISELITKNAIPITGLEVALSFVRIRSSSYFLLLVPILSRAEGQQCERCWHYETDIGQLSAHPSLCGRCVAVLAG